MTRSRCFRSNSTHGIKVAEAASANTTALPPGLQEVQQEIADIIQDPERLSAIANNMYRAHKQFIGEQEAWKHVGKKGR